MRDKEYINADFERLIAGESISKDIREDLTYDTISTFDAREALRQIRDRRYAEGLETEFDEVIHCGICFFKKQAVVKFES